MFGFLKKEQLPETPEITQSVDWTKDIKRSKKIGEEVEQLSFLYSSESNNETKGTKKGLSRDHLHILKKCKIDLDVFLEGIKNSKIKDELKNLTQKAHDKEIFGVPTYIVNDKIFWGQDRLEFAIDEYNK